MGAAAIAGPVAVGSMHGAFAKRAHEDASGADIAPGSLPVGYLEGSEDIGFDELRAAGRAPGAGVVLPANAVPVGRGRVVPAADLPSGDPGLVAGSARLMVHGMFMADPSLFVPDVDRLAVHVHFRVSDASRGSAHFAAWHYGRRPVANAGRSVGMTVPVGPDDGLRLTIERGNTRPMLTARLLDRVVHGRHADASPGAWSRDVVFTSGGEGTRRPRLRRGVYLIAVPSGEGRPGPDWRSHRFVRDGNGAALLVRQGLLGPEPADFDYLVVSVATAARTTLA